MIDYSENHFIFKAGTPYYAYTIGFHEKYYMEDVTVLYERDVINKGWNKRRDLGILHFMYKGERCSAYMRNGNITYVEAII